MEKPRSLLEVDSDTLTPAAQEILGQIKRARTPAQTHVGRRLAHEAARGLPRPQIELLNRLAEEAREELQLKGLEQKTVERSSLATRTLLHLSKKRGLLRVYWSESRSSGGVTIEKMILERRIIGKHN